MGSGKTDTGCRWSPTGADLKECVIMKIKTMLFSALLAFSVSGSAFAYTIAGGTDVGGVDTFLGQINGLSPSNPATEAAWASRSEEHTSELQSRPHLVCRLLLEKKKKKNNKNMNYYKVHEHTR